MNNEISKNGIFHIARLEKTSKDILDELCESGRAEAEKKTHIRGITERSRLIEINNSLKRAFGNGKGIKLSGKSTVLTIDDDARRMLELYRTIIRNGGEPEEHIPTEIKPVQSSHVTKPRKDRVHILHRHTETVLTWEDSTPYVIGVNNLEGEFLKGVKILTSKNDTIERLPVDKNLVLLDDNGPEKQRAIYHKLDPDLDGKRQTLDNKISEKNNRILYIQEEVDLIKLSLDTKEHDKRYSKLVQGTRTYKFQGRTILGITVPTRIWRFSVLRKIDTRNEKLKELTNELDTLTEQRQNLENIDIYETARARWGLVKAVRNDIVDVPVFLYDGNAALPQLISPRSKTTGLVSSYFSDGIRRIAENVGHTYSKTNTADIYQFPQAPDFESIEKELCSLSHELVRFSGLRVKPNRVA